MRTKETPFTQKLNVWAVPRGVYEIEQNPNIDPFKFSVSTDNSNWETGAVNVYSTEVTITVPAGIDLTQKAVETLEEALKQREADHYLTMQNIRQQISNLLLLTHRPEGDGTEIDHEF